MDEYITVRLPCKIGDTVWGISRRGGNRAVCSGKVSQMYFVDDAGGMKLVMTIRCVCSGEWGKQVFRSREDAWAAVKKRKDGDTDA